MRPCKHRPPHPSCTVCRLVAEATARGAKYRKLYGEPLPGDDALLAPARLPEPPGLLRKAANLVGAVAGHVAAGMPRASRELHAARVEECRRCEMNLRPAGGNPSCRLCGCNMEAKAWMAEKTCPHPGGDRWAGLGVAPTPAPPPPPASLVRRFDEHSLAPGLPGKRFNCSLLDDPGHPGGFLFCYRDGWAGSQVWLCRLTPDLLPLGSPWRLELHHPERASYGREDPRLFLHGGRVHVCYIGVVGPRTNLHTNVLFARLTADCSAVEERWYAHYPARNAWEKNWQPFSHGGDLYAVYSASPHRVLRVGGEAELAYDTPALFHWRGGEVRGGAAPVRVGGEYWSFFHDRVVARGGLRVYRLGLYCFSAEPPFAVTRYRPTPILEADPRTKPADQYCAAVFPCGAVRRGGRWLISMGVHDRWGEVHDFGHAELEASLVRVRPPGGWRWRGSREEEGMFASVNAADEYRLREHGVAGAAVLDVGAHCGSFLHHAAACGAAAVHCYEPNPETFALLRHNAGLVPGRHALFHAAVGSALPAEVVPGDQESASDSVRFGTGSVPGVRLDDAIAALCAESPDGRVGLLKLDCEGAEWPALAGCTLLHRVDRVAGEYHLPMVGGVGAKSAGPLAERAGVTPSAAWLRRVLRDAGFAAVDVPDVRPGHGSALFFARRV